MLLVSVTDTSPCLELKTHSRLNLSYCDIIRIEREKFQSRKMGIKTKWNFSVLKRLIWDRGEHRYLRIVDCPTLISLWKIHFNKTRTLVVGTKLGRLGSPNCPVSLPSWSAHLPCWPACFVLCPQLALAFQSMFLRHPLTVLTRQTRQAVCAIKQSIFNVMSMVEYWWRI